MSSTPQAAPWDARFDAPANPAHQWELGQVAGAIDDVEQFFNDFPGSKPDQEEGIEAKAREALAKLENFVTGRWGS